MLVNDGDVLLVIEEATGLVVNAIVAGAGWGPPEGHVALEPSDGAWIGWTRTADGWLPPADGG